ncbi:hypothetical protein Tco_0789241 [Tanacetum coccineum]
MSVEGGGITGSVPLGGETNSTVGTIAANRLGANVLLLSSFIILFIPHPHHRHQPQNESPSSSSNPSSPTVHGIDQTEPILGSSSSSYADDLSGLLQQLILVTQQ